jgi:hypothetical protein
MEPMSATFEKLNLKNQGQIVVLNAPESFEAELGALKGVTILRSLKNVNQIEFSLAFVTKQREVDTLAYPKGTSKKYKSEINRDHGWQVLGDLGFEPVRSVAIDEDWSGLRFRRVEFIKTMKRDKVYAMTSQGKARFRKK